MAETKKLSEAESQLNRRTDKMVKIEKMNLDADIVLEALAKESLEREMARRSFKDFIKYMMPEFAFSNFNLNLIQLLQECFE